MKQVIREMKKDLQLTPGVKIQIELPRSIHVRLQELVARDRDRSNSNRIYIRDKMLEAIYDGIQHLETEERNLESINLNQ